MHTLSLTDDYIFIERSKSSVLFIFSILVSVFIHIIFVTLIIDNYCFNCNSTTDIQTKPLSIQLYEEPPISAIVEVAEETIEQKNELLANISQKPENQIIETIPLILQSESTIIEPKKLNYATLYTSIEAVLQKDIQQNRQTLEKDCGNDCIPIIEQLGLKTDDPYGLAKIFKQLANTSSSKKKERVLAKLISNQQRMNELLNNENLDEETRAFFNEELAFLRGEIHYQDCDGKLNSGNCVGEVDLLKVASLLSLFGTL